MGRFIIPAGAIMTFLLLNPVSESFRWFAYCKSIFINTDLCIGFGLLAERDANQRQTATSALRKVAQ